MPIDASKLRSIKLTPEEEAAIEARFKETMRRLHEETDSAIEDISGKKGYKGWDNIPLPVIFDLAETVRAIKEEFGLVVTVNPPKMPRRSGGPTDEEVIEYGRQFEEEERSKEWFADNRTHYSYSQVRRILDRYKVLKAKSTQCEQK